MLILQLVLGFDLFRASEQELQRVEAHTREFSEAFMSALQLIFSGSCDITQIFNHPFFTEIVPVGQ